MPSVQFDNDLNKKIAALISFTENLKQELQLRLVESSELITLFFEVIDSHQPYLFIDNMLKEKIPSWELNKNEIKHAQLLRMLVRIYESIRDDLGRFIDKYQNKNYEDTIFMSFCNDVNQRIATIQADVLGNKDELLAMIEQAKITTQDNFSDVLKEIHQTTARFSVEMDKLKGLIDRSIRIKQAEKIMIAMPNNHLDCEIKSSPEWMEKPDEEKSRPILIDIVSLDKKFQNVSKHPKQTKKEAYLIALKEWVDNKNNPPPEELKVALANYLLIVSDHPLAKENRYRPLKIFSTKTTSMAIAQGILAKNISEEYKNKLHFNEKDLKRDNAREAYRIVRAS